MYSSDCLLMQFFYNFPIMLIFVLYFKHIKLETTNIFGHISSWISLFDPVKIHITFHCFNRQVQNLTNVWKDGNLIAHLYRCNDFFMQIIRRIPYMIFSTFSWKEIISLDNFILSRLLIYIEDWRFYHLKGIVLWLISDLILCNNL